MPLINENKKYIFCHLYKCGGMSLRTLLRNNIIGNKEVLKQHSLPRDVEQYYKQQNDLKTFNSLFKFTIVRNPFSFLTSLYFFARSTKTHFWHKQAMSMPFKDFPSFYMRKINYHTQKLGENKIISPYEFVRNNKGKVIVDYIGKLETFNKDVDFILNKIGEKPLKPPKININKLNSKPYQQVYDQKTREFVEKHFAKDLDFFEYEF